MDIQDPTGARAGHPESARRGAPRRRPDGPRERLATAGAEALNEAELVALVLRTGSARGDAARVAGDLLAGSGGLRGLARAARRELERSPGVGPAKAASLLAACEIGRRLARHRLRPGDPIRSPADVHGHLHARLRDTLQECFVAVLLDGRHRMLRDVVVSRGTLTASLVHPREVFRPAIREAAAALILVHNHPSGDPTPSPEDRAVTERLVEAGALLGVRVLDHVVVAERGYHSFSEAGELPEPLQAAGPVAAGQSPVGLPRSESGASAPTQAIGVRRAKAAPPPGR